MMVLRMMADEVKLQLFLKKMTAYQVKMVKHILNLVLNLQVLIII
jgi:hypothetical protein